MALPHYRGSSTHVYEVARSLTQLGHEVHVIARRVSGAEPGEERIDGIMIHRYQRGMFFSSPRSSFVDVESRGSYQGTTPTLVWRSYEIYLRTIFPLFIAVQVMRVVRKHSIDVVLERETSFGGGAIASALTDRPLVLEVIGNRVTNLQVARSSKIVTYSETMFRELADASKVEKVTAAVDTERFKPDAGAGQAVRNEYSLGNAPVVGYVGTFQEWHGLDELVEAASQVLRIVPGVKFLMVGPYYAETQRMADSAGLSNSFVFTGPVEYSRVPAFMNACDVLVAPYNPRRIRSTEQVRQHGLGSPLKVFEYMSSGKPVITTRVRPICDPVTDSVTGILVEPGNPEELAHAVVRVLQNKADASRMGASARASVIESYSWNNVAKSLVHILEAAVDQRSA